MVSLTVDLDSRSSERLRALAADLCNGEARLAGMLLAITLAGIDPPTVEQVLAGIELGEVRA